MATRTKSRRLPPRVLCAGLTVLLPVLFAVPDTARAQTGVSLQSTRQTAPTDIAALIADMLAAIRANPGKTVQLTAAALDVAPDAAARIAAAVVGLAPDLAAAVVALAVRANPAQAVQIAARASEAAPYKASEIMVQVMINAPGSPARLLQSVVAALGNNRAVIGRVLSVATPAAGNTSGPSPFGAEPLFPSSRVNPNTSENKGSTS